MAASNYASTTDLALYLPEVSTTANATIWGQLLNAASRFLDWKTGQYFYNDGNSLKTFNGTGDNYLETGKHSFFVKAGTIAACSGGATSLTFTSTSGAGTAGAPVQGDILNLDSGTNQEQVTINGGVIGTGPYTCPVTATAHAHAASTVASNFLLKLAYFENQPVANWLGPLPGDGYTPPSNYWLVPRNPDNAGSVTDTAALKPFYGVELATIPITNSNYLPQFLSMYNVASIQTYWGWPQVPDVIKNLTCELVARMWRDRESGWSGVIGSVDAGMTTMARYFSPMDHMLLKSSGLTRWSF